LSARDKALILHACFLGKLTMPRLLYIESSPRKTRSASTEVAQAFLSSYREALPNAFVDTLDLWAKPLPEFDQSMLDAKYAVMGGHAFSAPQKAAWAALEQMVDRIKAADVLLFSVPMWNFGLPYKLKHYLDLVMQPGLSFGFEPARGYFGLLLEKQAVTIYASGGDYAPGTPAEQMDFQRRYLHFALNFLGVSIQHEIRVAPTQAGGPEASAKARATAIERARAVALALSAN
jgi:FMN-dependent NADH-azoreductase